MITVKVSDNGTRTEKLVEESVTLRSVFEDCDINLSQGTVNLNGCTVGATDLDLTFGAFGISSGETCFLNNAVKSGGGID